MDFSLLFLFLVISFFLSSRIEFSPLVNKTSQHEVSKIIARTANSFHFIDYLTDKA